MSHTGKQTKIVATVGPSCDTEDMLRRLYESGVNVFRINFSHATYPYAVRIINNISKINRKIAILLDTKGPEVRTGEIGGGSVELYDAQTIIFTKDKILGTNKKITINYHKLEKLKKGNTILIDDGLIEAVVIGKVKDGVKAKLLNGGTLGSKKSVTIRGHSVELPFLSKKDKEDIMFGIKHKVDFVAASFVRTAKEVKDLRKFLEKNKSKAKIISKVEHWEAANNIKDIIDVSDGIMVARGDLGVEICLEKVPQLQADIINRCNELGKPVIVATQLLESMKEHPRPTRAEVGDVAHAINQGADAIMLSGETASGKYPLHAVRMMARLAHEYDKRTFSHIRDKLHNKEELEKHDVALFMTKSAYHASLALKCRAIITPTESGYTARKVSRFRPKVPILAISRKLSVVRQLQLSWGVLPMYEKKKFSTKDEMITHITKAAHKSKLLDKEDRIIVISGHKMKEGHTNNLEIYTVSDLLKNS